MKPKEPAYYSSEGRVLSIVEHIDFIRASMQAGGIHQHAFNLMADNDKLKEIEEALNAMVEKIIRELDKDASDVIARRGKYAR